jgi:hypothetical protein
MGRLVTDHKTIADFRKDSGRAINNVCAQFVALRGLLAKASVAIDGARHPDQAEGYARGLRSARSRSGVAKTRWPLGNSANGHLARWLFGCTFAYPLHLIWPKRDRGREAVRPPAQPEREASLFPAKNSDRFCGA